MGEYASVQGERIKLGTCESLYYVRHDQLHLLDKAADRSLYGGGSFRFRFPFLDEDGKAPGDFDNYDRGLSLPFGAKPGAAWAQDPEHHDAKWHSINSAGAYNVNVRVPCPVAIDRDIYQTSPIPERHPVEIVAQKPVGGELWTVLRCGWCGSMWRIDAEGAGELAVKLYDIGGDYWPEIGRRIAQGYARLRAVLIDDTQGGAQ